MFLKNKKLRYYYWLVKEFIKKNARLIFISFLVSIIVIIGSISISPYLVNVLSSKKEIIGMIGPYDLTTLPDEILTKISNGLVFVNEKGQITPILAESWDVHNGGKQYI